VINEVQLMEVLLRLEAEAKYFAGATDRSYEQTLMDELVQIVEEAELLFGPRDRSYELLVPRITECNFAHPFIYPFRKIRIYLTSHSKTRHIASYQLAHETVHVLSPTPSWATVLEEGIATYFSNRYMNRVYGLQFETPDRRYEAALRAVSPLMAKNEFVIKELRVRQPEISKIDEKLLVEVAGIDIEQARFLCAHFEKYWYKPLSWSESLAGAGKVFANGFRSIWG
jgi:hypothetical protein